MPQSGRKILSKTTVKPSAMQQRRLKEPVLGTPNAEKVGNLGYIANHFDVSKKPHHSLNLPKRLASGISAKAKAVGGIPENLGLNSFSNELLKPRDIGLGKLSKKSSNLLNRNVNTRDVLKANLIRNRCGASKFMSALIDKRRLMMHKSSRPPFRKEAGSDADRAEYLSHAKKLLMLEALQKESLPFLDLHVLFGVSKQTIRRLVKTGFLSEAWGPKAVGLRFKLSKKGRSYLNELVSASKYESKTMRKGFIRLKSKVSL